MRLRRVIPTSALGRTVAAAATASLTAGVALVAVGISGSSETGSGSAADPEAAPVAVARTGAGAASGEARTARASGVRLADYDPAASRAVLVPAKNGTGSGADSIKPGDVIASPPTAKAPNGALFKVGTVTRTDKGMEVTTEPATLSDALGSTEVTRTINAHALDMTVTPLVAGVQPARSTADLPGAASAPDSRTTPTPPVPTTTAPARTTPNSTGPRTSAPPATTATTPSLKVPSKKTPPVTTPSSARSVPRPSSGPASDITLPGLRPTVGKIVKPARMHDGGLLLGVDIPLAGLPGVTGTGRAGPKLAGWVGLTPKLIFSFNRDGAQPFQAEIGVGGTYRYGWQVHAKLDGLTDTGTLRLPFAEVHISNTFWVGPVPIVLGVDLTYFYRLTADGHVSIDTEQSTKGEFALGARYDARTGWRPVIRNDATRDMGGEQVIAGGGNVRAAIGTDMSFLLYGVAGVSGRLAPYVRAAVGAKPSTVLWGIYAGFDLTGALSVRLKILGISVLRADVPFPPVHGEWKVASSTPAPPDRPASASG